MQQRPLCQADNNTCKNLAENKGRLRSGGIKWGRYCDGHRRAGHREAALDPGNKRFIALDACVLCLHEQASDRHRIIQGGEYNKRNVIGLCRSCHQKVHRFYAYIQTVGFAVQ